MNNYFIYGYAHAQVGDFSYNGKTIGILKGRSMEEFLMEGYKFLDLQYPKFFKMDNLSKLGILTSELLCKHLPLIKEIPPDLVSVLINNRHSSEDTDLKYQATLNGEEYFPSPGLFVYTLPNIVLGEICIRNGFKGENLCLVSEQLDPHQVYWNVRSWLDMESEITICGWVDVCQQEAKATLMAVGKDKTASIAQFTPQTIEQIVHLS